MSFPIFLKRTNNKKNVINKTYVDDLTTQVDVTLKNETSITDPVFLISGDLNNITQFNYITCDFFKRNYFIIDIKQVRHNLYEITAHVDVLTTYASELLQTRCIFERQTNIFDPWLNDTNLKVEAYTQMQIKAFGFKFKPEQNLILSVIGGAN